MILKDFIDFCSVTSTLKPIILNTYVVTFKNAYPLDMPFPLVCLSKV